MKIIGTAGHVDHGKSTLISALTGIHPDRLKEEKEREMTIELGFGSLHLPNGEEVGIVDVPGHRDFIGNMLAGIGGIDAVLLVIAADEGIMPQTKEHLDIIHLLNIQHGVIVLTKIDMIDDSEWLQLIEMDIQQLVRDAGIPNFPLVKVSARKGVGIEELKQTLQSVIADTPQKPDLGKPRLSVDRVFSMVGFGTVVTGTLVEGSFILGDDIVCLPSGHKAKIRGLQNHNQKVEIATPGSRTAINISGLNVDQIRRGDVITKPNAFTPSKMVDATIKMVKQPEMVIKNNTEVKVFLGSSEVVGTLRILGADTIENGAEGFCQLILSEPIIASKHDHFILRRPSPSETIGGGVIISTEPKKRYKRADPQVIEDLQNVLQGSPSELLAIASIDQGVIQARDLFTLTNLDPETGLSALRECEKLGTITLLDPESPLTQTSTLINSTTLMDITSKITTLASTYHQSFPLRKGIPKEELKSKLTLGAKQINLLIGKSGLHDGGTYVSLQDHQVIFNAFEKTKVDQLINSLNKNPYATPSVAECKAMTNDEIYNALVDQRIIRQVSPEVVFLEVSYNEMVEAIARSFPRPTGFSVSQVRDLLGSSRKYILALLEYLDSAGITVRSGDERQFRPESIKN